MIKEIFFVFYILFATSFTIKNESSVEMNSFKKNFSKVTTDLFVCKYEVSNAEYRNFLSDLKNSNKNESYQSCLPDTLCWIDKLNIAKNTEPFVEYYFRNPSYDNYPVVGVSYESALKYCDWLTENYNQSHRRKFKKVFFKLLTKDEWTFAANKGDLSKVYTWGSGYIQNNRKQDLCNYRRIDYKYDSATKKYLEIEKTDIQKSVERNKITASVNAYFPNSFGLYNMCGNVAEMIEEKGIAKGGSYNDPAYKVTISSEVKFTKPQADIGFRVAMKIIEE
jgi:formylglycine-generating enzyme required for sulfatase activity